MEQMLVKVVKGNYRLQDFLLYNNGLAHRDLSLSNITGTRDNEKYI
jgi:hypothetical protein